MQVSWKFQKMMVSLTRQRHEAKDSCLASGVPGLFFLVLPLGAFGFKLSALRLGTLW